MLSYQKPSRKASGVCNKVKAGNSANVINYKRRMELMKKDYGLKLNRESGGDNSGSKNNGRASGSDYLDGYSSHENDCTGLSSTEDDEEAKEILGREAQNRRPQKSKQLVDS